MLEIDIYGAGLCFPEFEKQFEAIEAALGFKLFAWQKTYIATGNFRQTRQLAFRIFGGMEPLRRRYYGNLCR